jgi:hypothetical protein
MNNLPLSAYDIGEPRQSEKGGNQRRHPAKRDLVSGQSDFIPTEEMK